MFRQGKKKGTPAKMQDKQNDSVQKDDRDWQAQPLTNVMFEKYYSTVLGLDEQEWKTMMDTLVTPLPTTFRFTIGSEISMNMKEYMIKEYFPAIEVAIVDGEKVPVPKPLPWYPNEMGWHLDVPRGLLRKSAELKRFHQFLTTQTDAGFISRQEAVSMIPCLFMDVHENHFVLDMCASPGSKTAQLIEAMHINDNGNPSGIIVANDADYKRAHTLVHQSKRLNSPALVVTNQEAQRFPNIYHLNEDDSRGERIYFDRILCDVPCSGDGTLRKNKGIWKQWSTNCGNALHRLQIQILLRGLSMLKPGGRLVYSTCSFNPIENEAVVAMALRKNPEFVKLVDVRPNVPELITKPGLTAWKVMDKNGEFYESFEQFNEQADPSKKSSILETMFAQSDLAEMGIEKCMRLYPHLQNTGGFFVAVFEKSAEAPLNVVPPISAAQDVPQEGDVPQNDDVQEAIAGEPVVAEPTTEEPIDTAQETTGSKRKSVDESEPAVTKMAKVDVESEDTQGKAVNPHLVSAWPGTKRDTPVWFIKPECPDIQSVVDYFGIDPSTFPVDQFCVRSYSTTGKAIYYVSSAAKTFLTACKKVNIQIVHAGVKMFAKNDGNGKADCIHRIVHEGVEAIQNSLAGKNVFVPNLVDLEKIIMGEQLRWELECDDEMKNQMNAAPLGCMLMKIDRSHPTLSATLKDNILLPSPVYAPVWKGRSTINALLTKQEKASLYMRIFHKEMPELEEKAVVEVAEPAAPVDQPDI